MINIRPCLKQAAIMRTNLHYKMKCAPKCQLKILKRRKKKTKFNVNCKVVVIINQVSKKYQKNLEIWNNNNVLPAELYKIKLKN